MTDDRRGKRSSGDSRVPPHSLDAEVAAIGGALLSVASAEAFVAAVKPSDFFKPAHQHIAHAIHELAVADIGIDTITVAEQLRQNGLLETIGGTGALMEFLTNTPAISRTGHYCQIVADTSRLRHLLFTASDITDLAYNSVGDPGVAVARAAELLDGMLKLGATTRISTLDTADVAALLAGNLEPEQPVILTRTDGGAMLYPGKMHVFQAEPSSGKSWLALWAVAEILALGGSAVYLDFEDAPHGILRRLLALGVSPKALAERFYYTRPLTGFGPAELVELRQVLDDMNPDLVVIDGVGEALSRQGFSEDKADDVVKWTDLVPRPITATGAAVLMLDHVAKDPEQRGRWARGSGAKLAVTDGASYQVKVRRPFSRHREGEVDLVIAKDRPGAIGAIGEIAARITITPHAAGERVTVRIDPRPDTAPTDSWKPTIIMGKLWRALHDSTTPLSATALMSLVHAEKTELKREGISRLLAEGFIAETGGKRKVLQTVRPYDDGQPAPAAPAWRTPPPELFSDDDFGPSPDDIADIIAQDPEFFEPLEPDFYNHDDF